MAVVVLYFQKLNPFSGKNPRKKNGKPWIYGLKL